MFNSLGDGDGFGVNWSYEVSLSVIRERESLRRVHTVLSVLAL